MELVYGLVVVVESPRLVGVVVAEQGRELSGHLAVAAGHLADDRGDGLGNDRLRMPAAGHSCDVAGERGHPGEVLDDIDARDHLAEVTGDRRLE